MKRNIKGKSDKDALMSIKNTFFSKKNILQFFVLFAIYLFIAWPFNIPVVFADQSTAPPEPQDVQGVAISPKSIYLNWTDYDSLADFDHFRIYRDYQVLTNVTEDEFTDTGLQPDTLYKYEIFGVDSYGNEGPRAKINIMTESVNTTPPEIQDLAKNSAGSDMTFVFGTSRPTNVSISYGKDSPDEMSMNSTAYEEQHSISLSGLENSEYYDYRIKVCDEYNICYTTQEDIFMVGQDTNPPGLDVVIPEVVDEMFLDVKGTTEPYSTVFVSVNEQPTSDTRADSSGSFTIKDITLDPTGTSLLEFNVTDLAGNEFYKSFNVEVDSTPPSMELSDTPSLTDESNIRVEGSVSEAVTLKIFKHTGGKDTTAPSRVTGFDANLDGPEIDLRWSEVKDEDLRYYIIYRNGHVYETTTQNSYDDRKVNSSTSYNYRVSAIDNSCNEGSKSDSISITANQGNNVFEDSPVVEDCSLTPEIREDVPMGSFSKTLNLDSGTNVFEFIAIDNAGNEVKKTREIVMDNDNPDFEELNLDDISPSYVRDVKIEGKMSEPCTITITKNEGTDFEKNYTTETDESGYFSQEIMLSRVYSAEQQTNDDGSSNAGIGMGWENDIKITAEDNAGHTSVEEGTIEFKFCDQSVADWDVEFGQTMPAEIVPRLLLDGMASIGFTFELDYNGAFIDGDFPVVHSVSVQGQQLNMLDQDKFDLDWVSGEPTINYGNQNNTAGFVNIRLKAVDVGDPDMSMGEKEDLLAENHEGECLGSDRTLGISHANVDTGYGCVKLPLVMKISYGDGKVQNSCIDMSVMITPRVDVAGHIPEDFLKDSVDVIDDLLESIDWAREKVSWAAEKTTWACLGSWVAWFIPKATQFLSCNDPTIGHIELSDYVIGYDGESENYKLTLEGKKDGELEDAERTTVESCLASHEDSARLWNVVKYVCDRVMCPSIPSFQKYLEDMQGEDDSFCSNYQNSVKIFSKQSMDLEIDDEHEVDPAMKLLVGTLGPGEDFDGSPQHEYCEEEYKFEWSSACLMDDPYKKSFCSYAKERQDMLSPEVKSRYERDCGLGYQLFDFKQNFMGCKVEDMSEVAWEIDNDDWLSMNTGDSDDATTIDPQAYDNAVSAIEDVQGDCPEKDGIGKKAQCYDKFYDELDDSDPVEKDLAQSLKSCSEKDEQQDKVDCYRSTLREKKNIYNDATGSSVSSGSDYYYWIKRKGEGQPSDVSLAESSGEMRVSGGYLTNPQEKLKPIESLNINDCRGCNGCQECIEKGSCDYPTSEGRLRITKPVLDEMCVGDSQQKNIIDPTSGILTAGKCGCLTAVLSYLNQFAEVLRLVRNCFDTILKTGEGSAGTCQESLSIYLCDLIYQAIDCWVENSSSGFGTDADEGSNFFDLVGAAGNKVSEGVQGRYGDSNLYQVLFNEKSLVNSACIFFLTGSWPIDMEQAVNEQGAVAIDPIIYAQGDRRFQSYDPTTGWTKYIYGVTPMIIPGASDFSYSIELVCSADDSCDGPCDCMYAGQEKTMRITNNFGDGRLTPGNSLDETQFILVDSVQDSTNRGKVRYDKVRINYQYTDNEGESVDESKDFDIKSKGGKAPASCELDVKDGEFRCEVFVDQNGEVHFDDEIIPADDLFHVNDIVQMRQYSVYKKSPAENEPLTKYLKITVETPDGRAVNWNKQEGTNTKIIPVSKDGYSDFIAPRFRLTEDLVKREATRTRNTCDDLDKNGILVHKGSGCPRNTILVIPYSEDFDDEDNAPFFYLEGSISEKDDNIGGFDVGSDAQSCTFVDKEEDQYEMECAGVRFTIDNYDNIDLGSQTDLLKKLFEVDDVSDIDFTDGEIDVNKEIRIGDYTFNYFLLKVKDEEVDSGASPIETQWPDYLNVIFELYNQNSQYGIEELGSLIRWNGNPQKVTVKVPISSTEVGDETGEDDNTCNSDVVNNNQEPCDCGVDSCSYGEKCCINPARKDLASTGFCFRPDDDYVDCDDIAPEVDSNKIQFELGDFKSLEITYNIEDTAETTQKISNNVKVEAYLYDGTGLDCKPFRDSDIATGPIGVSTQLQLLDSWAGRRSYTGTVSQRLEENQLYYLKLGMHDSAGNVAPSSPPLFVKLEDGELHFSTFHSGLAVYQFPNDNVDTNEVTKRPDCSDSAGTSEDSDDADQGTASSSDDGGITATHKYEDPETDGTTYLAVVDGTVYYREGKTGEWKSAGVGSIDEYESLEEDRLQADLGIEQI